MSYGATEGGDADDFFKPDEDDIEEPMGDDIGLVDKSPPVAQSTGVRTATAVAAPAIAVAVAVATTASTTTLTVPPPAPPSPGPRVGVPEAVEPDSGCFPVLVDDSVCLSSHQ